MYIFMEHPEYESLFLDVESKVPLIKGLTEIMNEFKLQHWGINKRTEFFANISDWFTTGMIDIQDSAVLGVIHLFLRSKNQKEFDKILVPIDNLPNDKEKYLSLLGQHRGIETYFSIVGIPKGKRGIYDKIEPYLLTNIEYYREKIRIEKGQTEIEPTKDDIGEQQSFLIKKVKGLSHCKQMVLVDQLGIIKRLTENGFSKVEQAKIISLLVNKDEQNTREYLTYGFGNAEPKDQAKKKYYCNTPENIDFINNLLNGVNIP